MRLHQLLGQTVGLTLSNNTPDVEITGIAEDSRRVQPGDLFVARPGTKTDGSQFIRDAHAKGAAACITPTLVADCALPQIVIADPTAVTGKLAHALFGDPTRAVRTVGVTGTNGKTTTAYLLRHLLNQADQKCGMIGTVEIDDGQTRSEAVMTTPGAPDLAKLFAKMRDNGCAASVMETSSHALSQGRVAGISYAGAGFTNLTGDHLDYHKTMEAYAAAKAQLFASLDENAVAVINGSDPASDRMVRDCDARIVRFGFDDKADWQADRVNITAGGTSFTLLTPDGVVDIDSRLVGRHNVENVLLAAALAGEVYGFSLEEIASGLQTAVGAPGRLQVVSAGQPFTVLVDYAHTDDALENVLKALRPLTKGKLRVLFGCGGDRDATKRPRMAATAERLADAVYITSDNPRTEDPRLILADIQAGLTGSFAKAVSIEIDRRTAIQTILADAGPADVVLLAGKGHENYQIIGTEKHHFDDVEEAVNAISGRVAA